MAIKTRALEELRNTMSKIKANEYNAPSVNSFTTQELRVNSMGNVYVVDSRDEKSSFSSERIKRLIASRR